MVYEMPRLRLLAVVLGLLSCAGVQPALSTATPSPVVARYGGRAIRQAEVDQRAAEEREKLEERLYELRAETAEQLALETLVKEAAAKEGQGLSADDWLDREVARGAVEPTEKELEALFERAKDRLGPEVRFEDVRPQLRGAVAQEQKAGRARKLFERLKKEAGYELVLEPPLRTKRHVEALGPSRGAAEARVTIIEFADFQCPYCGRAAEVMEELLQAYEGRVRLVFRHFPLSFHPLASKAAEASACADEQGRFWEFHDALFESRALEPEALQAQAGRLGLDLERFAGCLDSGKTADVVRRDLAAGQQAGVTGTPAFFINGVFLSGAQPAEAFRRVIDRALATP